MLIKEGKNRVRDLIEDDITNGELGTDGTTPTEDDTGLGNPVAATEKAVSISTGDKQLVIDYNLLSTEGNGNTYREFEIQSSEADTSYNRIVFYDLSKDNTEEFQVSTILDIE
jgi:hypothetical protein|tara:strand:+ start:1383 stop:1721 length:339 start_codon:yes stop_codon:yes gene_type:complete